MPQAARQALADYRRIAEAHTVTWNPAPSPEGSWVRVATWMEMGRPREVYASLDARINRRFQVTETMYMNNGAWQDYTAMFPKNTPFQGGLEARKEALRRMIEPSGSAPDPDSEIIVRVVYDGYEWEATEPPPVKYVEVPVAVPQWFQHNDENTLEEAKRIAATLEADPELSLHVLRFWRKDGN